MVLRACYILNYLLNDSVSLSTDQNDIFSQPVRLYLSKRPASNSSELFNLTKLELV